MKKAILLAFVLSSSLAASVQAAPNDYRREQARYEEQRRDCEDERNNGQRKKCLREAERSHKVALANDRQDSRRSNKATCVDCGKVVGIRTEERGGDASPLGVVGGGAVGALLGNQVGSGSGRTLATVAGAVGGAYAGKKLSEKRNAQTIWTVDVQYDNGRRNAFQFDRDPGLQRGDRVKNASGSIMRL